MGRMSGRDASEAGSFSRSRKLPANGLPKSPERKSWLAGWFSSGMTDQPVGEASRAMGPAVGSAGRCEQRPDGGERAGGGGADDDGAAGEGGFSEFQRLLAGPGGDEVIVRRAGAGGIGGNFQPRERIGEFGEDLGFGGIGSGSERETEGIADLERRRGGRHRRGRHPTRRRR